MMNNIYHQADRFGQCKHKEQPDSPDVGRDCQSHRGPGATNSINTIS